MERLIVPTTVLKHVLPLLMCRKHYMIMLPALLFGFVQHSSAQLIKRLDSIVTENYHKVKYDTAYITRPQSKWTLVTRVNVSGATIRTEGRDNGQDFKAHMHARSKTTVSLGVGYQGIVLSLALNPAKLAGKYHDFELNLNCYKRSFGFDIIYQDAKNFSGWYDQEGKPRIDLPEEKLKVHTLNINAYYAFNNRRFSYPAAFSQSYIQRRSAGSFLLAASGMVQNATLDLEQQEKFKMVNIGLGGGYGYNWVPGKGWLLHLSLLPTLIVFSNPSLTIGDERATQPYKFPEFILTGRASVVHLWSNKYVGMSAVYNYTNVGNEDKLAVYNTKWRIRAFFGLRIPEKKKK